MKLCQKIFLSLFILVCVISVTLTFIFYDSFKKHEIKEYEKRYSALNITMSETLRQLEISSEEKIADAFYGIKLFVKYNGIPNDEDLRKLKNDFKITSLALIDSDGKFINSTSGAYKQMPNIYTLDKNYKKLITGETEYIETPLMPSIIDSRISKYGFIATPDKKYILEVGIEIDYLAKLFVPAILRDKNIESVGLYTPNGKSLAIYTQAGRIKNKITAPAITDNKISYDGNILEIVQHVPVTNENCGECIYKKLTLADNKYFYSLRTKVSLNELAATMKVVKIRLIGLLLITIIISFIISRKLSHILVSKIETISKKARNINKEKNLSVRLNVEGTDEIAMMGQEFDKTLQSLEEAQKELIINENLKTFNKISAQLTHDIRDPLCTLDVISEPKVFYTENSRLILKDMIDRMKDMANNLISKQSKINVTSIKLEEVPDTIPSVQYLPKLIKNIIGEKRLKNKIEIDYHGDSKDGLYSKIVPFEFKRTMSNLIDNSIDAGANKIDVNLYRIENEIILNIIDNGKGIPRHLIENIGKMDFTYGKENGHGLGAYYSRLCVQHWGGKIKYTQNDGAGITVTVTLPRAETQTSITEYVNL